MVISGNRYADYSSPFLFTQRPSPSPSNTLTSQHLSRSPTLYPDPPDPLDKELEDVVKYFVQNQTSYGDKESPSPSNRPDFAYQESKSKVEELDDMVERLNRYAKEVARKRKKNGTNDFVHSKAPRFDDDMRPYAMRTRKAKQPQEEEIGQKPENEEEEEDSPEVLNIVYSPESGERPAAVSVFPSDRMSDFKRNITDLGLTGSVNVDKVVEAVSQVMKGKGGVAATPTEVEELHTRITHVEGRPGAEVVQEQTRAVVDPGDLEAAPRVNVVSKEVRRGFLGGSTKDGESDFFGDLTSGKSPVDGGGGDMGGILGGGGADKNVKVNVTSKTNVVNIFTFNIFVNKNDDEEDEGYTAVQGSPFGTKVQTTADIFGTASSPDDPLQRILSSYSYQAAAAPEEKGDPEPREESLLDVLLRKQFEGLDSQDAVMDMPRRPQSYSGGKSDSPTRNKNRFNLLMKDKVPEVEEIDEVAEILDEFIVDLDDKKDGEKEEGNSEEGDQVKESENEGEEEQEGEEVPEITTDENGDILSSFSFGPISFTPGEGLKLAPISENEAEGEGSFGEEVLSEEERNKLLQALGAGAVPTAMAGAIATYPYWVPVVAGAASTAAAAAAGAGKRKRRSLGAKEEIQRKWLPYLMGTRFKKTEEEESEVSEEGEGGPKFTSQLEALVRLGKIEAEKREEEERQKIGFTTTTTSTTPTTTSTTLKTTTASSTTADIPTLSTKAATTTTGSPLAQSTNQYEESDTSPGSSSDPASLLSFWKNMYKKTKTSSSSSTVDLSSILKRGRPRTSSDSSFSSILHTTTPPPLHVTTKSFSKDEVKEHILRLPSLPRDPVILRKTSPFASTITIPTTTTTSTTPTTTTTSTTSTTTAAPARWTKPTQRNRISVSKRTFRPRIRTTTITTTTTTPTTTTRPTTTRKTSSEFILQSSTKIRPVPYHASLPLFSKIRPNKFSSPPPASPVHISTHGVKVEKDGDQKKLVWLTAKDILAELQKKSQLQQPQQENTFNLRTTALPPPPPPPPVTNSPIVIIPVDADGPAPSIDYESIRPMTKDKPITLVSLEEQDESEESEEDDQHKKNTLSFFLSKFVNKQDKATTTKSPSQLEEESVEEFDLGTTAAGLTMATRPPFKFVGKEALKFKDSPAPMPPVPYANTAALLHRRKPPAKVTIMADPLTELRLKLPVFKGGKGGGINFSKRATTDDEGKKSSSSSSSSSGDVNELDVVPYFASKNSAKKRPQNFRPVSKAKPKVTHYSSIPLKKKGEVEVSVVDSNGGNELERASDGLQKYLIKLKTNTNDPGSTVLKIRNSQSLKPPKKQINILPSPSSPSVVRKGTATAVVEPPPPVTVTSDSIKSLWTEEIIEKVIEKNKDLLNRVPDGESGAQKEEKHSYKINKDTWMFKPLDSAKEDEDESASSLFPAEQEVEDQSNEELLDKVAELQEYLTSTTTTTTTTKTPTSPEVGTDVYTADVEIPLPVPATPIFNSVSVVAQAPQAAIGDPPPRPSLPNSLLTLSGGAAAGNANGLSTAQVIGNALTQSAAPLAGISAATLAYGAAATLPVWLPMALGKKKRRRKKRDGSELDRLLEKRIPYRRRF